MIEDEYFSDKNSEHDREVLSCCENRSLEIIAFDGLMNQIKLHTLDLKTSWVRTVLIVFWSPEVG